jgi:protein TonB
MKDFFRQSKQLKVMMEEERLNKKNRVAAAITTAGLQGLLLVALFVLVAWRPPNPPLPEYGVELNFGLDAEGYGDLQPTEPVGNNGDKAEAPKRQEEPVSTPEVKEQPQPEVKQPARVPDPIDIKPEVAERNDDPESPVVVKEKKPEEKKPPVEKPVEKAPEKVVEKAPEIKVEEKKPVAPTVDSKAVFKPKEQTATGTGESGEKAGKPGNNGDDKGKVGDKGNPQGSLDAKALYGQPGGGGGGVSMSGFNGFAFPSVDAPALPDDAFGVYEFLVKVDDQGEVISVTSLKRGLSLEAEQKLKAVIQRLEFVPKGTNLPPQSEGKITFKVVSR